jgi:hypothetical protein
MEKSGSQSEVEHQSLQVRDEMGAEEEADPVDEEPKPVGKDDKVKIKKIILIINSHFLQLQNSAEAMVVRTGLKLKKGTLFKQKRHVDPRTIDLTIRKEQHGPRKTKVLTIPYIS